MSALNVRRAGYALGAEITGVDASKPLSDKDVETIRRAILDHIVVSISGQKLESAEFVRFGEQFGELDVPNTHVPHRHPDHPAVYVAVNKPIEVKGQQALTTAPMTHWHTDFTQTEDPATITFLLSQTLPAIGGDTLFSNQYVAYETLSPAFQRMIENLSGLHTHNRDRPQIVHPIVRVHPETGRKSLHVVERLRNILGMTEEESTPILDFIKSHSTRYEFLYQHHWKQHDLLIWDNRCSIHRVIPNFDHTQVRAMLRCSLVGPKIGKVYDEGFALAGR